MKVVPCFELAAGKSIKIGDILIVGVKKKETEKLLICSDKKAI